MGEQAMKRRVTITDNDRMEIERMWNSGAYVREISDKLGTSMGAIYKEIRRGFDGTAPMPGRSGYSAAVAIREARDAARRRAEALHGPRRRQIRVKQGKG